MVSGNRCVLDFVLVYYTTLYITRGRAGQVSLKLLKDQLWRPD